MQACTDDAANHKLLYSKIDQYFRTELVKLNAAQKAAKGSHLKVTRIQELIDLLVSVHSMPEAYFAEYGDELFSVAFRLTFYNHP